MSLDFYTNKTKQHLQAWTYCHLLGLEETSSVAYDLGETQTRKYIFFYFSIAKTLPKSLQACGKRRKTLKFWNSAISKYIQLAFSCVIEKLLIFYIYKI